MHFANSAVNPDGAPDTAAPWKSGP